MIYKQPKEATTELTYTRSGAATAQRKDGTLVEFAPNVIRRTDRGVLIEEQRTNLDPWSRNNPGWAATGTTPPIVNGDVIEDGRRCVSVTFPTLENGGYSVSRTEVTGYVNGCQIKGNTTYISSADFKLSRPLVPEESVVYYYTGTNGLGSVDFYFDRQHTGWIRRTSSRVTTLNFTTGSVIPVIFANRLLSPLTVFITDRQLEEASTPSSLIITTGAAATRGTDRLYAADAIPKNDFTLLWETECAASEASQWYLAPDAQAETIPEHPDEIVANLMTLVPWDTPAKVPSLPAAEVSNGAYTTPVGASRIVSFKAAVPWKQGEIYDVTVEVEVLAGSAAPLMSPYLRKLKADLMGVTVDPTEHYSFASAPVGQVTRRVIRFGMGLLPATPVGGIAVNVAETGGTAFVRFGALVNYRVDSSSPADHQSRLKLLTVRNVTAQVAAAFLPAQTIQIGTRAPSSRTAISQRRRHALRKQGSVLTEYLNGVPIKNRQGSTYSNLLIGGAGLEPINGVVETVKILPYALTDEELIKLTSLNDTTFDYLNPGGVYYYDAGQTAMPRKSQVVAPISSGRELIL